MRPGPAAGPPPTSAGRERVAGGLWTWLRPGAASQAPAEGRPRLESPHRAPLGGSSRGETEGGTGRAAGGDATPSLRALAAPATEGAEGAERAEQRRQAPQPRAPPPPPRARARTRAGREGKRARARAHLQPPKRPRRLALRPHPIGSAHLRPRRQPIGTRFAGRVGGPPSRKSRPPQRDWPRAARAGRVT